MATYLTGNTIRTLREKKGCTQRELAATLGVTDKAVSKWETGKGLPDIALIEPLAKALGVSVAELLSGACAVNGNRSANMLKTAFYVCPVCGNVVHATGEGSFSCCGITLPVQEPEDADQADEMHLVTVEQIDNDRYVRLPNHPMTKQHYVSFIAFVTTDLSLIHISSRCRLFRRAPVCTWMSVHSSRTRRLDPPPPARLPACKPPPAGLAVGRRDTREGVTDS